MKAFIAVALLVASVAAGPLSLLQKEQLLKLQEKALLDGKFGGKLGEIRGLPLTTYETERVNLPLVERLAGDRMNTIYTIEELYTTELFREYLAIPLFRQYMQYPVFQQYVASPLFQQFWATRQFQQYFRNPVLFYKYIYPQIQALKVEIEQVRGVDTEFVRPIDRVTRDNVNFFDYFRGIQGLNKNRFVDVEREVLPYTTGFNTKYYGQQRFDINNVNYKYLLEKIYRDLLLNKTPMTEVITDVKVLPKNVERQQIIDTITREPTMNFDNIKIVDGQIVRVQETPLNKIVKDELVKEELIKEDLIKNKLVKDELLKEELIKDDLYKNTLFKDDLVKDTLYKDLLIKDDLYKNAILKKLYLNKIFGNKVFGQDKIFGDKLFGQDKIFGDKIFGDKIFGQDKIFGDKIFGQDKIFGDKIFTDDMYTKTINKVFPMTEEYPEIVRRNTPAGMFKINEQELMYPTMYNNRFGKNMLFNKNIFLNKFLEGEKMVTPTMYNRELFTPKEFTLGEDKINMYNPMYNTMLKEAKDMYYTQVPTTMEGKMMYNTMPFETLNKEIKY
jgi:hypothetical protein